MIKGLGEARARCAGEVLRLEALLLRITADLAKSKGDLESLDRVIRLADKRLDPESARAVRPQRVRSKDAGKKLSLEEAMLLILQENPETPRSTVELAFELASRLKLDFDDDRSFGKWLHNSVARRLKKMTVAGVVVRLHEASQTPRVGWWQIAQGRACSLEELKRRLEAAGQVVEMVRAPLEPPEAPEAPAEALPS